MDIRNKSTARSLGVIVSLTGALVMAGWIFDIAILKSILPHWVTMKFSTALSFFCSGFVLYSVASSLDREEPLHQIALSISVLIIMLLMGILLASTVLEIQSSGEELFVKEKAGAVMGRPSVGSMVNFLLISAAGIGVLFGGRGPRLTHFAEPVNCCGRYARSRRLYPADACTLLRD